MYYEAIYREIRPRTVIAPSSDVILLYGLRDVDISRANTV